MKKIGHIIGNGDTAHEFNNQPRQGLKIACNIPPFWIPDLWATVIIDFKMCVALAKGDTFNLDAYKWIIGNRPHRFMNTRSDNPEHDAFYRQFKSMHYHKVRHEYLTIPKYAENIEEFVTFYFTDGTNQTFPSSMLVSVNNTNVTLGNLQVGDQFDSCGNQKQIKRKEIRQSKKHICRDFNCGHVATHYAANFLELDEIHLYGFDSLFHTNVSSYTDYVIKSNRGVANNQRLVDTWRPIWQGIFDEFPDINFVFHYPDYHKIKVGEKNTNVTVINS
jgi:hypothetical protein